MGFQKIDKKQMPQVIGLGVASCSMFGYFAYKMIAPTVSAAPAPPAKAATAAGPAAATAGPATAATTATAAAAPVADAQPPTPGMRDPFIPTITDQDAAPTAPQASAVAPAPAAPKKTQVARREGGETSSYSVPQALPLPGQDQEEATTPPAARGDRPQAATVLGIAPLPVVPIAPAPPAWTVTGVLQSGKDNLAILRSGDVRRLVKAGDMVDGQFRIIGVTRQYVILRHGEQTYTLPLGGAPADDKGKGAAKDTAHSVPFSAAPSLPEIPAAAPTQATAPTQTSAPTAATVPVSDSTTPTDAYTVPAAKRDVLTLIADWHAPQTAAETDQQIRRFRQATVADPQVVAAHVILGALYSDKALFVTRKTDQTRLLRGSIHQERVAIGLQPDAATASVAHSTIGMDDAHLHRFRMAVRECRQAIHLDPDAAGGYAGLGVVLGMKERYWSSVPLLEKAHDLDPENADISNNLGNAYYIEGKTEKAIAQLRTALRHHPKPQLAESIYKNLAKALARKSA